MRRALPWVFAGLILAGAIAVVTGSSAGAAASTLGRGPLGWLGFARLLEQRGVTVERLDRPLEHLDAGVPGATLLVAFPWQSARSSFEPAPLLGFVRRGGRLVVATSGAPPGPAERALLDALGVEPGQRPASPPLRPLRWWRERRAGASWPAGGDAPWSATLRTGALRAVPRPPPAGAGTTAALAVDERGGVVASIFALGEGEVWLLPAQVFANAWLGEPGNATLALALADSLGERAMFDEYHHGLVGARGDAAGGAARRSFDAVLLQLALVWALALLTLGWRFGPTWRTPALPADAHRAFLVGLGALHHRLGHDREAARALVHRVAAYAPGVLPPDRVERALERADAVPFTRLARDLSRPTRPRERTEETPA
jgi:hypothetical protein